MEPSRPVQTLEFEDYKNDTQYEEYEEYEDHFEFAERDGAQTWDGEVIPALRSECYWQTTERFITVCVCSSASRGPEGRKARRESRPLLNRWAACGSQQVVL